MKYGEYVRTKNGQISKNNSSYDWDLSETYINDSPVVNHSKNIIDLIQTGDVVKYELVEHIEINDVKKYKDPRSGKEYLGLRGYNLKQVEILEILTKEQLQQNSYKVVE